MQSNMTLCHFLRKVGRRHFTTAPPFVIRCFIITLQGLSIRLGYKKMSPKRVISKIARVNRYNALKDDHVNVDYDDRKPLRNDAHVSKGKKATDEVPLIFRSYSAATTSSYSTSAGGPPPLDGDPTISSSYEEELPTKEDVQHQILLVNDFMREREQIKAENERLAARLREAEATIQKLSSGKQQPLSSPGLMQASFDDSTISTASYVRFGIHRTGTYDSSDIPSIPKFAIHRTGTYDSAEVSGIPSRVKYGHPATILDGVDEEQKTEHKKKTSLLSVFCKKKTSGKKDKKAVAGSNGVVSKPSYSFDDDTATGAF